MDFFGARYFGSAQGRFTSPDEPLIDQFEDDPQSWNLYSYVRNNPLLFTDPTGQACNASWEDDDQPGPTCQQVREDDKKLKEVVVEDKFEESLNPSLLAVAKGTQLAEPAVTFFTGATLAFMGGAGVAGIATSFAPSALTTLGRIAPIIGNEAWRLIDPSRPLSKMGHAAKHVQAFKALDPSLTNTDVARILEYVRRTGTPTPGPHGSKSFTAKVFIAGKEVTVKVVQSVSGLIKSGFPRTP